RGDDARDERGDDAAARVHDERLAPLPQARDRAAVLEGGERRGGWAVLTVPPLRERERERAPRDQEQAGARELQRSTAHARLQRAPGDARDVAPGGGDGGEERGRGGERLDGAVCVGAAREDDVPQVDRGQRDI